MLLELCKLIYTDNSEVPPSDLWQPSKSSDVRADIESLKLGQQVNGEAIQTLSDSIFHTTSVISQLQDFVEKNKEDLRGTTLVKPTIMNEHIEYGNQPHVYNANNAESNNPAVSDELGPAQTSDFS